MKFCHAMIRVKDAGRSLQFYKRLFKMDLESEMLLDDCKLYFLNEKESGFQLELTQNFETPEEGYQKGTNFGHFAFCVKDLALFEDSMKELGVKWKYEPFMLPNYSFRIGFIEDPDGNEIEIIEE